MKGCLVTDVNVNNKKCFFTCLYRSPSQNPNKQEQFCTNFDLLLSNINNLYSTSSILIGDFNTKCSKWCASDENNTAGIESDKVVTTSGYSQMTDVATQFVILSSSCIDLIFSVNVSLTKNCGVEQSFYE